MNDALKKINGYGAMAIRGTIVVLIPICIFFGNQLSQDIRTKFTELTVDMRVIRSDIGELQSSIVGKTTYYRDQGMLRASIHRIEDKIDKYHSNGGMR